MEITITINGLEKLVNALELLATSIGGAKTFIPEQGIRNPENPSLPVQVAMNAAPAPTYAAAPVQEYPSNPVPQAPVAPSNPVPQTATNVSAVPTNVPLAPTATPATYTLDVLGTAAAPLMAAGRQQELVGLLQSFGVQALTQLPPDRYGEFATALRGLGAKL
jgi:hypothetical protein